MAIERLWEGIPARAFTADGQANGIVTLESTIQFRVKQSVKLTAMGFDPIKLQVKRVLSSTQMILGPDDGKLTSRQDLSLYLLGTMPMVSAPEQDKTSIPEKDQLNMTLEREPVNARRVFIVDDFGDAIGTTPQNPIHTQLSNGSVNIGTVNAELEVQLSHRDNYPDQGDVADSVQIGDGEDILRINPDGSISTADSGLDRRLDVENNIIYEGVAEPGGNESDPVWRISRTVKTPEGDLVTTLAGTGKFDQVWDDRVSLFPPTTELDFFDRRFERLLPLLSNANWMKLGNFDRVVPSFNGDTITMSYYEAGAQIGKANIKYTHDLDWEINLERYVNDSDGDILLDDDDEPLNLD